MLAGPTCNCEKAVPYFRRELADPPIPEPIAPVEPLPEPPQFEIDNVAGNLNSEEHVSIGLRLFQEQDFSVQCEQCPFFWTTCVLNGFDTKCGRGCALAASYNGKSFYLLDITSI